MTNQTVFVLDKLATKLGTTGEYLWGVLLRQAPITATLNLVYVVLAIGFLIWAWWFVIRKTMGDDPDWEFDEGGIPAWLILIVLTLIFVPTAIIGLFEGVIAAVNPEYWALDQILDALRPPK